jgi:hypothetical protein
MKLLNILNENYDQNKLLKKGKAVYTVLKSGKINYQRDEDNEPARLTYTLSDERNIYISVKGDIWIRPMKIKVREENKECLKMSSGRVQDLIKEKFERFNISLNLMNFNPREDWDTWLDREILNEEMDNNLTEKGRKKANLIYKTFKTGKFKPSAGSQSMYEYELPDEYWLSNDDESGNPIVVLTMNPQQRMKMYLNIGGHISYVEREGHHSLYEWMQDEIKNKFLQFSVEIIF